MRLGPLPVRAMFQHLVKELTVRLSWLPLALAAYLALSGLAKATPCEGIDVPMDAESKAALSPIIARQFKSKDVKILRAFTFGGWSIIYADFPDSDPAFLFFKGNPSKSRYITTWGGAAMIFEEPRIRLWTLAHVPGIPSPLASCFAWFVTPPNRSE